MKRKKSKITGFLNILLLSIFSLCLMVNCEDENESNLPKLPIMEIISPQENDFIGLGEKITISLKATSGARRRVETYLYIDEIEVGYFTEQFITYFIEPNSLELGKHHIKAIAYDDLGNVNTNEIYISIVMPYGESPDLVTFNDQLPLAWYCNNWIIEPTGGIDNSATIISNPGEGTLVASKSFDTEGNITFNVMTNGGELAFYDNGYLKAQWFNSEGWNEYSYYVSEGEHTFRWKSLSEDICLDNVRFIEGVVKHTPGEHYEGGIIYYLDSTQLHGLIASESDLGRVQWGCLESGVTSGNKASSQTDGAANTEAIIQDCPEGNIAAKLCAEYVVVEDSNTFDDWYLPAPWELEKLYCVKHIFRNFREDYPNDLYWTSYFWYWADDYWEMGQGAGTISFQNGQGHGARVFQEWNVRAVRSF